MTLIIAAVLLIGGLGAAALFAIGVPALFGLMAWDAVSHGRDPVAESVSPEEQSWLRSKESAQGRISLERGIARAFVMLGGAFWGVAVFAGLYSYRESGIAWSLLGAFVPFVATLATLILGWYYERVTAVLLTLASAGVIVWGVIYGFELGVWMLVTIALIGPMLTAAVLFWMARREQQALEVMVASRAELVPVTISGK
jgi:hypothetical protein